MNKLGKKIRHFGYATLLAFIAAAVLASHTFAGNAPTTQPAAAQAAAHPKPKLDDAAVLAFLKQYEPEVYDGALVLQTKDPAKFAEMLKAFNADVCNLIDIQKRNAPLFEVTVRDRRLGYQAFQLAKELRAFQHIGILSLEFHVDKLSRPLL